MCSPEATANGKKKGVGGLTKSQKRFRNHVVKQTLVSISAVEKWWTPPSCVVVLVDLP